MLDSNMRPYLMTLAEMKAYLPNLQKSSGAKHAIPKKRKGGDGPPKEDGGRTNKHQKGRKKKSRKSRPTH